MLLGLLATGCASNPFASCSDLGPCPDGMVRFESTSFTMGEQHANQPWHEQAHPVEVDAFCMDVYEYPNREGEMPRSEISWVDAEAACQSEGKRLCSSSEWELACRGTTQRRFSYGSERDASRCNTPIEGSGPGQGPIPLQPIGSFPDCVSEEGVHDLNGSLSEWVADPWDGPAPSFQPDAVIDPETWRTLRGGTMWSQTFYGQNCTSRHGHPKEGWTNNDDGFRCCRDG